MVTTSPNSDTKTRKIIHIDMDAFYASVEQRDNNELKGHPVIVGGRPDGRGVVAACSYETREYGVHSAMPSREAYRRCPQAQFVKPRFAVYQTVSKQIQGIFREFSSIVEPLSLDEAYIDVTGSQAFDGSAVRIAEEIRSIIEQSTQLTASAGVSYNKFLAKIASDMNKPNGIYTILPRDGEAFVSTLPIRKFYGVGKATETRMHELGINTGADLRAWTLPELAQEFGKSANYFYNVARAIDERPVRSSRTRKSIGSETTFGENLIDQSEMLNVLERLVGRVTQELQKKSLSATTVTLKLRFANFETFTRTHTHPTTFTDGTIPNRILPFLLARALQARDQHPYAPMQSTGRQNAVRLLGVSLSGLSSDDDEASQEQLELGL